MEMKLEDFVAALLRRFNENGKCSHPSYAYGVAWDLIDTLSVTERQLQLLRLLLLFDGSDQLDCTVAHVVAAGSLVVACGPARGDEIVRWETAMRRILTADPPFSADIHLAVCFCVARAAVSGCSFALVDAAGTSLRGVASDTSVTEDVAVRLLAECTCALVGAQRVEGDGHCDWAGNTTGKYDHQPHVVELKNTLITYALDALSGPRVVALPSSLLSRRVLIPLLLSGGHEALKNHHSRLQSFLCSLSKDATRRGEVVVFIASLFDYLFSFTDCDMELDYRCSSDLWNTLHAAFWDALTCSEDSGKRASMLLRAEYLLKRIVDLTYEQQKREKWANNIFFNRFFFWVPAVSHAQWSLFFVILESTNEFGVHIVEPALKKLDILTKSLDNDTAMWNNGGDERGTEAAANNFFGGIYPAWVELLFLKLLLHPNTTVRKSGLLRLWSLNSKVLAMFSSAFIFTNAMEASLDPQLCTELDRVVRVSTIEGVDEPEPVVNMAGSLVEQLGAFYSRVFLKVLHTADERKEALRCMLRCVTARPSVHGVTIFFCIFHSIAETLALDDEKTSARLTVKMITDTSVLQELFRFLLDTAHENIPFWLDVRLCAVAFNAFLKFALIDPMTVRQCSGFWTLLCTCGPLGNRGGGSAAAVDSVGHVGAIGTCIHPYFFNEQLLRVSCKAQFAQDNFGFLRALLQTNELLEKVRQFLCTSSFDKTRGKELFFLTGALDMAGPEDKQLLATVAHEIAAVILSFSRRPYAHVGAFLSGLLAFVELSHSLGVEACSRYFSLETVIELGDSVYTLALSALRQATLSLSSLFTFDDISGEVWCLQHTTEWDALVAAALSAGQIAVFHDPTCERTWLKVQQHVNELILLLTSNFSDGKKDDFLDATTKTIRHFAKIVIARNASCLLQAALCGFIAQETPVRSTCFLRGMRNGDIASLFQGKITVHLSYWIRTLMQCASLRLTTNDIPCSSLTDLSWATVLAQYYGGIYNAVFILCNLVNPRKYPELVVEMQNYALDHVERCWGTNLASVYDILAWVVTTTTTNTDANENNTSTDTSSTGVDYHAIIRAMFAHLNDVGARFCGRLSIIAFSVLSCVLTDHTELVKTYALKVLLNDTDSERSAYVVAATIATMILRDPVANWPSLKDILLHVAVLYNPSRDEEGFETIVAATEPLLFLWSESLREQYPPTVRLSSVARALSISTILWCCNLRSDWATELSLELLDWNSNHPTIALGPCMPNSKSHRCRIRLWQLLCSLLPLVDDTAAQCDMLRIVVNKSLSITNLSSVRHLMELYALKLLESQPSMYWVIDTAVENYSLRPQVVGSYILIMVHIMLRQLSGRVEQVDGLFKTFLHRLFQQSISHQYILRIISHIGLYHIYEVCLKQGVLFCAGEEMMLNHIAKAPEHLKFRKKYKEDIIFDLDKAYTPRQLFCVRRREGNMLLFESIPASVFERMCYCNHEISCIMGASGPVEMLRVQNILDRIEAHRILDSLKSFPYIPHVESYTTCSVDYTAAALALLTVEFNNDVSNNSTGDNKRDSNLACGDGDENIQRKITPWWDSLVHNELHPKALTSKKRQPFVVVGSLLQNPVNVAGLFRCGEIFAMEKVVVSDPAVFDHPHFIAAARSSELWLPWDSVPVKSLAEYLDSLRLSGYTIIGIEQTSASVSMASYSFPERVAILLGAEGHGVPAELLPLLDVCVEIPQFGLIRSFNVHVAGAIVMYEYTRQYLMKQKGVCPAIPNDINS